MQARQSGHYLGFVLETPDPRALAGFYQRLLGWELKRDDETWCTLHPGEGTTYLGFHQSLEYIQPTWPPADGEQQAMGHLDVEVGDLQAAVDEAVALGAVEAGFQPQDDVRVMLDPDGHPFCLYAKG